MTSKYTIIPVYISRHGKLPENYGAFVSWEIGQRCKIATRDDSGFVIGTINSETRTHDSAPKINGARGRGRWVREVICDDTGEPAAISEERLRDL